MREDRSTENEDKDDDDSDDAPTACGNCGSANIKKCQLPVTARVGGHFNEDGELVKPQFFLPNVVEFTIASYKCEDCGANLVNHGAIEEYVNELIEKAQKDSRVNLN
jgi:DNA-directed RNA polymerase subunit RPC12/RpoP